MLRTLIFLLLVFLWTPPLAAAQSLGPALTIPEIQGAGETSPFAGQKLARPVHGCITGVTAEGFFLQDLRGDANPATSDGIYVFRYSAWKNPRSLKPGDLVEVLAYKVTEFYGQTELNGLSNDKNSSYRLLGRCALPAPIRIATPDDPQADPAGQYERIEGMRVSLDLDGSVVGPTQRFESRYPAGDPEITVVSNRSPYFGRRIFASELPVNRGTLALSGGLGVDLTAANALDQISVRELTGVLAYQFGRYVLLADSSKRIEVQGSPVALPSLPQAEAEEWTLCTFNAENLFDAVDDSDGDAGDWTPKSDRIYTAGVKRRAALIRQRLGSCTILAVQEVEGKDKVWEDFARSLGPNYLFDYRESQDVRDITVGLIYDGARVELLGSRSGQACTRTDYQVNYASAQGPRSEPDPCPHATYPLYDRPPYVADVVVTNASGRYRAEVRLVVVHLKSKRGDEAISSDRRVEQARYVAALLEDDRNAPRLRIALGDFNDDLGSQAMDQLRGCVNLYERHTAPADHYSYIYNGRAQAVDHIVMTRETDAFYLAGGPVHVNADFAEPLPGAEGRTSDHDPLLVRFSFQPTGISTGLMGAMSGAAATTNSSA